MSKLGIRWEIDGVPAAFITRGTTNGHYRITFERSETGLEQIEQINWSHPTLTNLSGSATLMVGQYRNGQMVKVQSQTVTANGTCTLSGFTHQTGDTYKAFLLDGDSAPLCNADDFTAG